MHIHSSDRARSLCLAIAAAALFSIGAAPLAMADGQDPLPQIRLTYSDLSLERPADRQALVERVQSVATDHCARFGRLIVPYERRLQPRYCVVAVRGEILRAMPRDVRAAYDLGRSRPGS